MFEKNGFCKVLASVALMSGVCATPAMAQETIKLGLSIPLSGAGANWGRGSEWLCKEAAKEVAQEGGVKVGGKVYNFQCVAYDNKYNAAEGTKVAQALLNRDGIKFIGGSLGTAPVKALQSLSEREGVLHFTTAWGSTIKGPKFPLTFTIMNTPNEISYPLTAAIKEANPSIKTVALLNPNDASGQETEVIARKAWAAAGVNVVSSDWYDRGTTEFQPIASKMSATKADVVDLGGTPPSDSGLVFKELQAIGWKGVKVVQVGTGAEGVIASGGPAAEGVYMGAAVVFEGPQVTEKQRKLNDGGKAATEEPTHADSFATGHHRASDWFDLRSLFPGPDADLWRHEDRELRARPVFHTVCPSGGGAGPVVRIQGLRHHHGLPVLRQRGCRGSGGTGHGVLPVRFPVLPA
ncbi:MAG: amino acid ABC transporter substrate-binding protein [Comamonadaceae bacterium]|nr:MAG: amino acid ABC transporter substrate-binding protein [Comamonadaceae bacterium]